MTELEPFKDQKKLRTAEIITPPNILKQKMGSGGIDPASLVKAEKVIEKNTIDFIPIAKELLKTLETSLENAKSGVLQGEAAIESMLHPAVQLKAQGTLFHFPLVTEVSNTLVNFLETVENMDKDVMEIVTAHKTVIGLVISNNMHGDNHPQGSALKTSLLDACTRYYNRLK